MGAVPPTRAMLDKAGLRVDDINVIESNETFAA
ncbi:hypothetical protein [Pigmentiphaga sp.]